MAGSAVSLYGRVCGESADGGATLFVIALAMWATARFHERPGWPAALGFTFAVTFAALLRPDGALVALAFAPALHRDTGSAQGRAEESAGGLVTHGGWFACCWR